MPQEKTKKRKQDNPEEKTIEELSYDRIALCLPGGGFRAASYSLGIIDFLNDMDLLKNVKSISSVSGGTITAARYAYSIAKDEDYSVFYSGLSTWLAENKLLSSALDRLNGWKSFGHKRKNLINAFALEYNGFLDGMTFDYLEQKLDASDSLEEVIFNSTDFSKGYQFRFRTGKRRKFGNKDNNYPELKPYVKLGDIVAASSCFPLGFEPISFPQDFVKPLDLKKTEGENPNKNYNSIGLMDGGIMDNLGIISHLTSSTNTATSFIVGDAGRLDIDPFEFSEDSRKARYISLLFSWWPFLLSLLLCLTSIQFNWSIGWSMLCLSLFSVLLVIQLIYEFVLGYGQRKLNLNSRLRLPRRKLGLFILNRLNSVVTMNSSIFLKGAKGSNLDRFYEAYKNKVCSSQIFLFHGVLQLRDKLEELDVIVSDKEAALSEECSLMETTLWFTPKHIKYKLLDKLILCGKMTCCYAMMQQQVKTKGERYMRLDSDPTFISLRDKWKDLVQRCQGDIA